MKKSKPKEKSKLHPTPDIISTGGYVIPGIRKDSAKGTKADYTKCK